MSVPFLSVVIPTSGRVDLFRETLDSLRVQDVDSPWELVVADDSPDPADRAAIAQAVSAFDHAALTGCRYLFTAPRLGQSANSNQGLDAAVGTYVRVLHSDDLMAPWGLSRECHIARQVGGDAPLMTSMPRRFGERFIPMGANCTALVQVEWWIENRLPVGAMLPSTLVFSRRFLDRGIRFDPRYDFCCDWFLTFDLLRASLDDGGLVAWNTADWVGYRNHGESVSGRLWRVHYAESQKFLHHVLTCGLLGDRLGWDEARVRAWARLAFRQLRQRGITLFLIAPHDDFDADAEVLGQLMIADADHEYCPFDAADWAFWEDMAETLFHPPLRALARRLRDRLHAMADFRAGPGRRVGVAVGVETFNGAFGKFFHNGEDFTLCLPRGPERWDLSPLRRHVDAIDEVVLNLMGAGPRQTELLALTAALVPPGKRLAVVCAPADFAEVSCRGEDLAADGFAIVGRSGNGAECRLVLRRGGGA